MNGQAREITPMAMTAFLDALDRYGAPIERWPAALQQAARALTASEPAARQALGEAARLGAALAALPRAPADPSYAIRIAARVREQATAAADQFGLGRLMAWGSTALAASMVAGFLAGSAVTPSADTSSSLAELVFPDVVADAGETL